MNSPEDIMLRIPETRFEDLPAQQRKGIAYHEAAHAVMEWLWKESEIVRIDMRATGDCWAFVHIRRGNTPRMIRLAIDRAPELSRRWAVSLAMSVLAGRAAEKLDHQSWPDWFDELASFLDLEEAEPGLDVTDAIEASKALHGTADGQWRRFLGTVAQWTHDAIYHPKVWPIVQALGERLLTQKTMQGSIVLRIIEKAAGDGWDVPCRFHCLGREWRRRLPAAQDLVSEGELPKVPSFSAAILAVAVVRRLIFRSKLFAQDWDLLAFAFDALVDCGLRHENCERIIQYGREFLETREGDRADELRQWVGMAASHLQYEIVALRDREQSSN